MLLTHSVLTSPNSSLLAMRGLFRQSLRLGIKRLPKHLGDIRSLEGKLRDYYRLRVGSYRVIFRRRIEKGEPIVECLYANRRSIVYEVFEKLAGHPE